MELVARNLIKIDRPPEPEPAPELEEKGGQEQEAVVPTEPEIHVLADDDESDAENPNQLPQDVDIEQPEIASCSHSKPLKGAGKCLLCPNGTCWNPVSELDLGFVESRPFVVSPVVLAGRPINRFSAMQLWELCYPFATLPSMLEAINSSGRFKQKHGDKWCDVEKGQFLRFLGIILAMVKWGSSGSIRNFWSRTEPEETVQPAPAFGELYGMKRLEWEAIWTNFSVSLVSADDYLGDKYIGMRSFVQAFNEQRSYNFSPSETLVVDESSSQWRGKEERKGHLMGIPVLTRNPKKPHPVAIESKILVDGTTGIVLAAEVMEGKSLMAGKEYVAVYGATTACVLRLTKLHWNSRRRVLGDSWFSSVRCASALHIRGLHFTGVVKTAYQRFPLAYLKQELVDAKRGKTIVCQTTVEATLDDATFKFPIAAVGWQDKKTKCLSQRQEALRPVGLMNENDSERQGIQSMQKRNCLFEKLNKRNSQNRIGRTVDWSIATTTSVIPAWTWRQFLAHITGSPACGLRSLHFPLWMRFCCMLSSTRRIRMNTQKH